MALNARQQRFVEEYLIDLNATQAAIRAGYSAKRASELGYQLLQKPTVQAAITRLKATISERNEITHDRIMQEWSKIGFLDGRRLCDSDGKPLPVDKLPDDIAASISSIDIDADGRVKLRFWDKNKALAEMAQRVPAPATATATALDDDEFVKNLLSAVDAANKLRE